MKSKFMAFLNKMTPAIAFIVIAVGVLYVAFFDTKVSVIVERSRQVIDVRTAPEMKIQPHINSQEARSELDRALFTAIAQIESGGDPSEYNESEDAAGIVQIRMVMLRDVNRIMKLYGHDHEFTEQDRYDPEASFEMFWWYQDHYAKHYGDYSIEGKIRRWVAGPDGHTQDEPLPYMEKVLAVLRSM